VHRDALDAGWDLARRTMAAGGSLSADIVELPNGNGYAVADHTLGKEQWHWLRRQIVSRPKWVAEMVGIEQIGYLAELPKPTPSPSLEEVGKLCLERAKISSNWRAKCKQFWAEFRKSVDVVKLRELTQEHVVEYGDMILDAGETPTYARQRFGAVKTVINFGPKRGKWAEDSKRALAFCAVLVPPKKSAADPQPINVDDFHALYCAADSQMQAMLLLSLNACMYGGEAAVVNWSDIDLEKAILSTDRRKTHDVRIATLWPETVAALKQLPHQADALFLTETGTQADYLWAYRQFKQVRKAAKADRAQFCQLRDGSYTAAAEAGVDLNVCRLLAGHATGISDHYIKRRPAMVAPACEAIYKAYRIASLPLFQEASGRTLGNGGCHFDVQR
jgi:integrase